jgi:hypothetical protein
VWDHFEEEEFEEDGVMKLQSRCKWPGCGKAMSTGGQRRNRPHGEAHCLAPG